MSKALVAATMAVIAALAGLVQTVHAGERHSGKVVVDDAVTNRSGTIMIDELGPWRVDKGVIRLRRHSIIANPSTKIASYIRVNIPGRFQGDFLEVSFDLLRRRARRFRDRRVRACRPAPRRVAHRGRGAHAGGRRPVLKRSPGRDAMLVEQIMRSKPVTATPATTLADAFELMHERGVRHLPIVENGQLVGIVSDRDLKRAMASPTTGLETKEEVSYLFGHLPLSRIMTRAVIVVSPNAPVEEAARVLVSEKISALPVTLEGRLVGIVTETDVLQLVVRALGAGEPSSRLDVRLGPARAALAEVVRIVEAAGLSISSIMTLDGADGPREVVVRVPTIDPRPAVHALEAKGYAVTTPWRG